MEKKSGKHDRFCKFLNLFHEKTIFMSGGMELVAQDMIVVSSGAGVILAAGLLNTTL